MYVYGWKSLNLSNNNTDIKSYNDTLNHAETELNAVLLFVQLFHQET
jgi:hypothetical protein